MSTVGSKFWLLLPNNKQNVNTSITSLHNRWSLHAFLVAHDTHHTVTRSLPPHILTAHNCGKFGCKGRRHTSVSKSYNLCFLFFFYFLHQGRKLFLSNTVCKAHSKLKHRNIKSKHAKGKNRMLRSLRWHKTCTNFQWKHLSQANCQRIH